MLLQNYGAVEKEIREVFRARANPLDRTVEALVSFHRSDEKRRNQKLRDGIISDAKALLRTGPRLADEDEAAARRSNKVADTAKKKTAKGNDE